MKKILIPVMLGLLCAPVSADQNLHEFVRELGYTGDFILENLPKNSGPRRQATVEPKPGYAMPQRQLMAPDDLLHPRIMQNSESPRMIPVLMRYHRKNPASAKITRKLAVTCIRNGQPREALYWYTQTWQRDRSDFESLWNMASVAYQLGEFDLTRKYLEEYDKVDPNSAWGRMAREFLAGRFSGSDLADGFKAEFAQTGSSDGSAPAKPGASGVARGSEKPVDGGGIMVIEGKRVSFDQFMSGYEKIDDVPVKINDTVKGKQKVRSWPKAEADKNKSSLQKAEIVETVTEVRAKITPDTTDEVSLPEAKAVTATAPPLIP